MARRATTSGRKGAAKTPDASTRVCVLHGPEATKRLDLLAALHKAMVERHGEVQRVEMEGKSLEPASVFDELRGFSLLGQYKLVVVNEAEGFVTANRKLLERYAAAPVDHATLVLCCGRWHKGGLDKLIEKVGCIVSCTAATAPEAVRWVSERAAAVHGRRIGGPAASLLVERVGSDLGRLDQELAKLTVMGDPSSPIDKAMVEQLVGRSSDEDAWAVQEAVLGVVASGRRGGDLIAKVHELLDEANQPDVLVNYFVTDLMRKLQMGVAMRAQRVGGRQVASELKLWGPRATTFLRAAEKVDFTTAAGLFDRAVAGDRRSKTGLGTARSNLETLCCVVADELA